MKTITIGRGEGCDIFVDDTRISRRHALIKIKPFGKMEIVDMGQNGTWVNGVKLRPNVPFPVKRSDVVSFAETSRLNWSMVPNPLKPYKICAVVLVSILLCVAILIFVLKMMDSNSTPEKTGSGDPVVEQSLTKDSITNQVEVKKDKVEQQAKEGDSKSIDQLFPQKEKNDKKDEVKTVEKETEKNKNNTSQEKKEEETNIEIL